MIHIALTYTLIALLAFCTYRYLQAFHAWTGRLCDPAVASMSEAQRAAYMQTPEYAALRGAVRSAILYSAIACS